MGACTWESPEEDCKGTSASLSARTGRSACWQARVWWEGRSEAKPHQPGASAEVFLFRHRPAQEQKCPQKKAKAFIIGAFSDHTGKGPLKWTGWRLLCP